MQLRRIINETHFVIKYTLVTTFACIILYSAYESMFNVMKRNYIAIASPINAYTYIICISYVAVYQHNLV